MSEFGDRLGAQREVIRAINRATWKEPLFGLSHRAIQRWADKNHIAADSELALILRRVSERLGFLANRSQMQLSDEYRRAWKDVHDAKQEVSEALQAFRR